MNCLKICDWHKTALIHNSLRSLSTTYPLNSSNMQNGPTKRRVVVTGLGVVSPVGCNVQTAWKNILSGFCGIKQLNDPVYQSLPCKIAAKIPEEDLKLDEHFSKSDLRALAPATAYALIAAQQAVEMSKWQPTSENDKERTGVAIGMGMVDLQNICETSAVFEKKGNNRVSPFFVPRILANMASGQVSMKYGFRGPNHTVSTACATGAHAIGDSFRFIQHNDAEVMICGGTEACISPLSIAGFCRLRALNTNHNEEPLKASRPFDRDRAGFVMGEGSAIFVLEELQHAKQRNADIIAEICGYGLSGDASHITAPHPEGTGAILAMRAALRDAQLPHEDVGYVNAHATSTPIGDNIEATAIQTLFGSHTKNVAVSSTKGAHGHLLGAAGSLEAMFTMLACRDGQLPPNLNLENIPEAISSVNLVANQSRVWPNSSGKKRVALKNAFGFGGTNTSLCISEFKE